MNQHPPHSSAEICLRGAEHSIGVCDVKAIYAEMVRGRDHLDFESQRVAWFEWWLGAALGAAIDGDSTAAVVALTQAGAAIAAASEISGDAKWTSAADALIDRTPALLRRARNHEVRALLAEFRALRCRAGGHHARAQALEQLRRLHDVQARTTVKGG